MPRKLKQEFFRDGDKYVALTGESPKQFRGLVFVAFVGNSAGSISETPLMRDKLEKMTQIEGADLPDNWADAFRAKGFVIAKPEPEPEEYDEPDDEPDDYGEYEEFDPEEHKPPERRTERRPERRPEQRTELPAVEVKLDFKPNAGTKVLIGAFMMLTVIGFIVLSILQLIERAL